MSLTPLHRKKDAIRFKNYNGSNAYCILGGLTPWSNESTPPPVPVDLIDIPDKFAAIKAVVRIVKIDNAGIYSAQVPGDTPGTLVTKTFAELTTDSAVLAWSGDVFVMMQATVQDDDITGVSFYRKLGWTTNLVATAGHSSDLYLPSANVSNWGAIESIEYRKPYPVNSGSQHDFFQIYQY